MTNARMAEERHQTVILIPALNEATTLGAVVGVARAWGPVLVVDDGSTDATAEVARAAGAEVLRHARRRGKGAALRTGLAAARARGARAVVTLDADGQHDPADVGRLLAAAAARPGAVVVGSRAGVAADLPSERRNAMRITAFFVGWATGLALADTQSGFRVYPLDVVDACAARRGGFVFETEVLVSAARTGAPVCEVAVRSAPRRRGRSRFRPLWDGLAITGFLVGPVLRRWGDEARAAGAEVLAVLRPERRAVRHAAILAAAAGAEGPGWMLAVGLAATARAVARVRAWWRHPRLRRALGAGAATVAAPLVLPLLAGQALAGRALPDVLTPLVGRLYGAAGEPDVRAPRTDSLPAPSAIWR